MHSHAITTLGHDPQLVQTIKLIDALIHQLCSQQHLSKDAESKLMRAMLSLKLDYSSTELEFLLNDKNAGISQNTLHYIHAHHARYSSIHHILTTNPDVNVDIIIKGYIDGGDFGGAQKLVKEGLVSTNDLCRVYLLHGMHLHVKIVRDAQSIIHTINAIKFYRDNDHTESLSALRSVINEYAGTNNREDVKAYGLYIQLRQAYSNLNHRFRISLMPSNQLINDLASVDAECVNILKTKAAITCNNETSSKGHVIHSNFG